MAAGGFRPTELDLALAADPVAEAARIALSIAAGELPTSPSSGGNARNRDEVQDERALEERLAE